MFNTTRDRKFFVFGVSVSLLPIAVYFPVIFCVIAALLCAGGAVIAAATIYDWIISGDEVLEDEAAQQRRERGIDMGPGDRNSPDWTRDSEYDRH